MSDLSDKDFGVLHHTLGIADHRVEEPYRNHFVASDGHHDMPAIERLCAAGFMKEQKAPSFIGDGQRVFCVTESGTTKAIETRPAPPKLTRSKARYQRYLEYGDGFDSFIDFCRWDSDPDREWNDAINRSFCDSQGCY